MEVSRVIQLNIIVAMNQDNIIGIENQVPWHLSEDLKYFKATTLNSTVIMGRRTYESIGRVLNMRNNIIISKSLSYMVDGARVCNDITNAIMYAKSLDKPIFIIGGGEVYKNTLSIVDNLYITNVDYDIDIQNKHVVYFPKIDYSKWDLVEKNSYISKNNIKYSICRYTKK